jgi:anti-sigma factor RsiW
MSCRATEANLSAYADHELSGDEMLEVRAHLAQCEACREDLESLVLLKRVLGNLEVPEPSPDFELRLLENVAAPAPARFGFTFRRSGAVFAGVAACSMFATLMALQFLASPDPEMERVTRVEEDKIHLEVQRDQFYFVSDPTSGAPVLTSSSYAGR